MRVLDEFEGIGQMHSRIIYLKLGQIVKRCFAPTTHEGKMLIGLLATCLITNLQPVEYKC